MVIRTAWIVAELEPPIRPVIETCWAPSSALIQLASVSVVNRSEHRKFVVHEVITGRRHTGRC